MKAHAFRVSAPATRLCAASALLLLGFTPADAQTSRLQPVTVAAGVPLQVRITHGARLHVGRHVTGVLIAPIWVRTRLVAPAGTPVTGVITRLVPVPHAERVQALLNADVTPLRAPIVDFQTLQLRGVAISIEAEGGERQLETVRFVPGPHRSLVGRLTDTAKEKIHSVWEEAAAPGRGDRALRLLYNQFPYHPQRVWIDTDMVADLANPAQVEMAAEQVPPEIPQRDLIASLPPNAVVSARLVTPIDSDSAKHGDPVRAIVTAPLYGPQQRLLVAQGAALEGTVQSAKASRSFGRNGSLRFSFRELRRAADAKPQQVFGNLTGAQGGAKANLKVDAEGNVQAQPAENRFVAPLVLGVLALHSQDDDGGAGAQVVGANGLGFIGRIVAYTAASRNVATGIGAYGFAKSVYFRFVARGHAVDFPKDTNIELQLSGR